MANWTMKHIEQLHKSGKILGYKLPAEKKDKPADQRMPHKKVKALIWLDWNIQYWCNSKALTLVTEHKFCPDRGWRFDYAIPSMKIAVEYEGGIYMQASGHNTAKHYTKDTDKYNRAVILGWKVIRVTAMNYQTVLKQLEAMI